MSGSRNSVAGTVPAIAAAAAAAGLALLLAIAGSAVREARHDAAGDLARMAAALWELPGGGDAAVAAFLPERARIEAVAEGGTGAPADPGAWAYRAGTLEPGARIGVAAAGDTSPLPRTATLIALLGLSLLAAWAWKRRRSSPPPRYPAAPALLAVGLLAAVAGAGKAWADRELHLVSAGQAAHAARAVGVALATGAAPEIAPRVAGLPWATAAALESPGELWTMPREVAVALAASPSSPPGERAYTVRVRGATYHGAAVAFRPAPGADTPGRAPDTLHLALLGYEETHSPAVPLAAAALGSALLVSLILFLLPLSARPRALRRTLAAWGFLAPAGALLLVFTFGPLLFSLWISLHEWHLVDPAHPFTGLDNYRALLADGSWWSAIRNTAVFTLHVPLAMAVALALAILTRGSRRAVRWARLALFLPSITSVVAIAVVWKWLLNDGYGLVNRALEAMGPGSAAWLTSPDIALATLMAISVWMVVGYQMVVFQAGLASIPRDFYDAARVDGAGPLQRFRHITLPGLRHTLFFVLVTSVIGSFQVFGLVYVMTEGGPLGATDVAVYHIYREAWEFLRFGNAAAMSWILFAVVFAATWLHFRFLERRGARA